MKKKFNFKNGVVIDGYFYDGFDPKVSGIYGGLNYLLSARGFYLEPNTLEIDKSISRVTRFTSLSNAADFFGKKVFNVFFSKLWTI